MKLQKKTAGDRLLALVMVLVMVLTLAPSTATGAPGDGVTVTITESATPSDASATGTITYQKQNAAESTTAPDATATDAGSFSRTLSLDNNWTGTVTIEAPEGYRIASVSVISRGTTTNETVGAYETTHTVSLSSVRSDVTIAVAYQKVYQVNVSYSTESEDGVTAEVTLNDTEVTNGTAYADYAEADTEAASLGIELSDDYNGQYCISAVTIAGESMSLEENVVSYENTTDVISADGSDVDIVITVSKVMHTVSLVAYDTEAGSVTFTYTDENGEEIATDTDGAAVSVQAWYGTDVKVDVTANSAEDADAETGYQISEILLNGAAQSLGSEGEAVYDAAISSAVTEDTSIVVSFIREYIVAVTCEGQGSAVSDPAFTEETTDGGTVTVTKGTDVKVTAEPENGYRVSSVTIATGTDAEAVEQLETADIVNDGGWEGTLGSVEYPYVVTVTFTSNEYTLTTDMTAAEGSEESDKCTIEPSQANTAYGDESAVDITLTWEDGYYISDFDISVTDGGTDNSDGDDAFTVSDTSVGDHELTITITDIVADLTVTAEYAQMDEITTADYEVTEADAEKTETDEKGNEQTVYAYVTTYGTDKETSESDTYSMDVEISTSTYKVISIGGKANEAAKEVAGTAKAGAEDVVISKLYFAATGLGSNDLQAGDYWTDIFEDILYWTSADVNIRLTFDDAPSAGISAVDVSTGKINNKDVTFTVTASDVEEDDYAGLAKVEWQLVTEKGKKSDWETIYKDEITTDEYDEDNSSVSTSESLSVTMDWKTARQYNDSCTIYVRVTDVLGNVTVVTDEIEILETEIEIKMDGTANDEALDGIYTERTAAITITERNNYFDKTKVVITATGTDADGNVVVTSDSEDAEDYYTLSDWTSADAGNNSTTYTATLTFSGDADYVWAFSYTNKAATYTADLDGVSDEDVFTVTDEDVTDDNPDVTWAFQVDTSAPTGNIIITYMPVLAENAGEGSVFTKEFRSYVGEALSYKFYMASMTRAVAEVTDATSGAADDGTLGYTVSGINESKTYYYVQEIANGTSAADKDAAAEALTEADLEELWTAWVAQSEDEAERDDTFTTEVSAITTDSTVVVYARIVDNAGNVTWLSSDAAIVDITIPQITVTLPDSTDADYVCADGEAVDAYYNCDAGEGITVTVEVTDILNGEDATIYSYSGISTVDYTIEADGVETEKGNLYSFSYEDADGSPAYGELQAEVSGDEIKEIFIDTEKYNRCQVTVTVTAYDNAGNAAETVVKVLDIDVTEPEIDVIWADGADDDNAEHTGYYDTTRTAEITVTERGEHFDYLAAPISITAQDVNGTDLALEDVLVILAGDEELTYVESLADLASASGTWTCLKGADDNGSTFYLVYVNGWVLTSAEDPNEDTHTISITFEGDANYTFDISCTDTAGNANTEVTYNNTESNNAFTVDQTGPEAAITISDGDTEVSWLSKLLTTITFGLISDDSLTVEITADDATSPIKLEYYVMEKTAGTLNGSVYTESQLAGLSGWTTVANANDAGELAASLKYTDDQIVVYVRVTDYAGNQIYICSDGGAISDTMAPELTLTPETPDVDNGTSGTYGYYNLSNDGTVSVAVKVSDVDADNNNTFSGLASVTYEVLCNGETTQSGTLQSLADENPTYEELDANKTYSGTISVDAAKNNSCDVVVKVTATDKAGNSTTKSVKLDIDVTAPTIAISYDNNTARNSRYFDAARTATIVITERTSHFDADDVNITITATDVNGNTVSGVSLNSMLSSWKTVEGTDENAATHTATITYSADANYTFAISYTDTAGNAATSISTGSSVAPYRFTVDKTAPTGTVTATSAEGRTETWGESGRPLSSLTFGFWSNTRITVTGTSNDVTSPIESVEYYKTAQTTALTTSQLSGITGWTSFSSLNFTSDEQFVIYLKITDYAGNVTYIDTDGLIVDETLPVEEYTAPEIYIDADSADDVYNNSDVGISVTVTDPTAGSTYSGLTRIWYEVYNMDVSETNPTQSAELWSFGITSPTSAQLVQTRSEAFTVLAANNNSNNVKVVVYAEDNAGNTSQKEIYVQIDTTNPVIDVTYSQTTEPSNSTYYKVQRTAEIVVTERNFDAADIVITVTRTDDNGNVTTLTQDDYGLNVNSAWTTGTASAGANGDGTTHTATIVFGTDGDYTFDISYMDLAENDCEEVHYSGGNEQSFTVDLTNPVISVSYDDEGNSGATNSSYFDGSRTVTITVTEHNFAADQVTIVMTKDGTAYTPEFTWSTSGNVHTARFTLEEDGDYTFDIYMTDLADNACGSEDVVYAGGESVQSFTVDKTSADLSVNITEVESGAFDGADSTKELETGTAHKHAIRIEISYSDTNLNSELCSVSLNKAKTYTDNNTLVLLNEDVTDQYVTLTEADDTTGLVVIDGFQTYDEATGTYTYSQDDDAIYTLNITVFDKAGNEVTIDPIQFTVNRFGSVYLFNEALIDLQDTYVQAVSSELVITEYNADRLVEDSLNIEITRDGAALSGVSYTVDDSYNEINADAQILDGDLWYQYQYVIDTSNFETDGIYTIVASTEDEAGNYPETTNYEEYEVLFRKDSTSPEITWVTGLEKSSVRAESVTVNYEVYDAIALKTIEVLVNGSTVATVDVQEETDWNTQSGSFEISAQNYAQSVQIIVTDMAGNVTDTSETDSNGDYTFNPGYTFNHTITVSTNLFVLWYSHKVLFWGSIIGAVLVIGGIIFFIIWKRRKKDEEEPEGEENGEQAGE